MRTCMRAGNRSAIHKARWHEQNGPSDACTHAQIHVPAGGDTATSSDTDEQRQTQTQTDTDSHGHRHKPYREALHTQTPHVFACFVTYRDAMISLVN